jgi:hypothetical protein
MRFFGFWSVQNNSTHHQSKANVLFLMYKEPLLYLLVVFIYEYKQPHTAEFTKSLDMINSAGQYYYYIYLRSFS